DTGEAGVKGVTFQLYQETNGTAGLQTGTSGDKLVATTTTSSTGAYSFSGLGAGTYYVKEVVPTGWISTTPNPVTVVEASGGYDVVGRSGHTDPTNFGDAHITTGSGNARTMGYWANSNGQTVLTGKSGGTTLLAKFQAIFTTAAGTAVSNGNGAL